MALKFLIDERKASTDQDIAQIRAETKRQYAQILSDAKESAKQIVEEGKKQGHEAVEREKVAIAAAELQAQKIIADAKKTLLKQVYDELEADLSKIPSDKRYPQLFKALVEEAAHEFGKDFVLQCNKKDSSLAKKYGKVSSTIDCSGGVIASSKDGLVRANNTLEAILEDSTEDIQQKAYQELFGGKAVSKPKAASAKTAVPAKKAPAKEKSSKKSRK